jgi:DNA (cytosine-5)-methyltransferase 1
MTRPRLLDLFSGAGGAAAGYHRAGFDVVGVDVVNQPHYPFEFVQADAMTFPLGGFDVIHASPPCQDHSGTRVLGAGHGTGWMLRATVDRLTATGLPWVVENVRGAPVAHQDDLFGANGLELCGCMFTGLRGLLYEARWFETSFPVPQPRHTKHLWPLTKMGRPPQPGECMQVTGHFSDVPEAQRRMGLPWMTRDELAQAICPAYTEYIGLQVFAPAETGAPGPRTSGYRRELEVPEPRTWLYPTTFDLVESGLPDLAFTGPSSATRGAHGSPHPARPSGGF